MRATQAIILAAGGGTRMKSQTPKVLHPICGRPMIAYALDLVAAAGIRQPVVILGEDADEIKSQLPSEVRIVVQKVPRGTGDAVLTAKKTVGGASGDMLILYGDTPLVRRTTIQHLLESHHKSNATCTLLTAHLADPSGYGRIMRSATGSVAGVVEDADANAAQRAIREINVGPICIKAQPLFDALATIQPSATKKEWYLTQAVTALAQQEGTKIQTVRVEEIIEAQGVNGREDLARATAIIRQRIIDVHLNNGVTIVDPSATYIDHGVTIGQDTTIHPGTVLESGVSIGKRCAVGPFARLRAGTSVGDNSRIGNFVELVRTKVGENVRINHMTYLGDTTVEDDVNIGAGTITANYDGAAKHPTVIGKGAFIGCDTVLIAPVKVGPGAVTGAGSVIPKGHDVPPRGVVVGVPAHPHPMNGGAAPAASDSPKSRPVKRAARAAKNGGVRAAKPRKAVVAALRHAAAKRRVKPARPRPSAKRAGGVKAKAAKRVKTSKKHAHR